MTGWLRNTFGADKASDAQAAATAQALAGEKEALDYLKSREELPMQIRDQALTGLSQFYQVPGQQAQPRSQDELIAEAKASPLYAAIMGTKQDAVDEMARYASATGGLRSGNANAAFAREGQRVANEALLNSFSQVQSRDDFRLGRSDQERVLQLSGLSGLANLPDNAGAIAGTLAGMGNTRAQGTIAQANTQTGAMNNAFNTLLGFGQMAAGAGWFSDIRLKDNIHYLGKRLGMDFYAWNWNSLAKEKFGLEGDAQGVIAHHVFETHPDAVGVHEGFLTVYYDRLMEAA